MVDLTRAEINETLATHFNQIPGDVARLIAQLLRQLDAAEAQRAEQWRMRRDADGSRDVARSAIAVANARADAAAGQMRERCVGMIETHALAYSNGPPKLVIHTRALDDIHHRTISAAIRALPLHEEPKP